MQGIDPRLDSQTMEALAPYLKGSISTKGTIGKHQYELCLKQIYFQSQNFLSNRKDVQYFFRQKYLLSLKGNIVRYFASYGLDWREHLHSTSFGYLIVIPNTNSNLYFECLAYKLYMSLPNEIRPILDFHAVNSDTSQKKTSSKNSELKFSFYSGLEFYVTHFLTTVCPNTEPEVIGQVRTWLENRFDSMSEAELQIYRKYNFNSEASTNLAIPGETTQTQKLKTGCDDQLVIAYFRLLEKQHHEEKGKPFVSPEQVEILLYKWFGIGKCPTYENYPNSTITRNQLVTFVHVFINDVVDDRSSKVVSMATLLPFVYEEFRELFLNSRLKNALKNYTRYIEDPVHRVLDWKQDKAVKSMINAKKG